MSSVLYNIAKAGIENGSIDLDTNTIKALLITGTPAINVDHDDVAAVLAANAEASGTGYASGPGGAGRKTVTVSVAVDDTNDRSDATIAATSWSAILLGATIKAVLYYKHVSGTDDTLNIPIAITDAATGLPFTTNGSDLNLGASIVRVS